ncbi:CAP domain-containing protein [Corynebacterium sp. UMB6689]|uniref:CAP domain-containing protein n=1 Tax=unclassified Corynebacterium TaxID=2624378 RepID=UPI0008A5F6D3|nr:MULTISPECIES: CAP domain-containing protein [unclassified Corynebacterium]MDK6813244.1 CAP domain-containing protein [Corynebacterium sp. UMB6689]OFL24489.1 hypothetical protein HMPREF2781_02920 [Corynebacterium sp. HMSC062A03]OFQ33606.1 hypothetical protein HMPREF2943_04550 [Corynebacterium sp. HMSC072D12]
MFRLHFRHTATKIVVPIAATAALFAGSLNTPAQAASSFGSSAPAALLNTKPSASGPAAPAPRASASVQGIIKQTNAQRVANGLAPLRVDTNLTNLAQDWANTLSRDGKTRHRPNYWTHYPAGLPAGGENVLQAWSDYSDARVVQLWMDSPGHRRNLLDPRATSVGIGMAIGADGKLYAVQNFGR